jgi:hypothetical protein
MLQRDRRLWQTMQRGARTGMQQSARLVVGSLMGGE